MRSQLTLYDGFYNGFSLIKVRIEEKETNPFQNWLSVKDGFFDEIQDYTNDNEKLEVGLYGGRDGWW